MRAFLDGEDLRGADAHAVAPAAAADGATLWCRAWTRPHRLLGYVRDPAWAVSGGEGRRFASGSIVIGQEVAEQDVVTEWWDCDAGAILARTTAHHPGGRLELPLPAFQRHLAFKLIGGG